MDIPLALYLFILLLSLLFSIDSRTSWLGYYSRFNGGLVSQICYALLYWAFVSNMTAKQSLFAIRYSLFAATIASLLAVLEHFGIFTTCKLLGFNLYESCWVQDVQNRVFSTLGQPNWLAALIVALLPMTWLLMLTVKKIDAKYLSFTFLSFIFFITLLFTKSRSGLLAFGVEAIIFWGLVFWQTKLKYSKKFLTIFFSSLILFIFFNSPLTTLDSTQKISTGTTLETGGTESGVIRKYVWIGAINVFKNYPILGSGPETFAYVFPKFKPIEHNLTSEWDYIYNKAHNEYLNYLANTGLLGLLSYLFIIGSILKLFIQKLSITNYKLQITNNLEFRIYNLALMSGFASILITNFFGFSVVTTSLLFFLFPALAVVSSTQNVEWQKTNRLTIYQILATIVVLLTTYYLLHTTYYYWRADIHYNKAKNNGGEQEINEALKISPNEPLYIAELAFINQDANLAAKALDLNPYDQNIRNILISTLIKNASAEANYLLIAEKIAEEGTLVAPQNPKIFYQLALLNLKNNKIQESLKNFDRAIKLKPNYKEAYFAKGLTLIDLKRYGEAITALQYILDKIDPNDDLTKKYLQEAVSMF